MSYLFNDLVGFKADAVDAFNRLKVSQPFTIFDSQHRYKINDKWGYLTGTGGSTGYAIDESTVLLTTSTSSGSKVSAETKRVFPYQPGKSLLILNTFAMGATAEGLRQRVGYFGVSGSTPYNGIYLEQNGLTLSVVLQSASLNTTTIVNQKDWNGDKFDGTGSSGRTLNVTKGNIFWTDIEWLGVGDVRTGFFVDGKPVIAHTFHNDNTYNTTYMTTASLPIRYEIENLTAQGITHTMRQICSSVMSEAGFEGFSREYNVNLSGTTATNLSTVGTIYPLIAIRLNSSKLDSVVVPSSVSAVLEETTNNKPDVVLYKIFINPTLTGNTWTTHTNGTVDYNITATAITGGTEVVSGYLSSGGLKLSDVNNFNYQIGRSQLGVSDVFAITASPVNANAKIYMDLSWYEII